MEGVEPIIVMDTISKLYESQQAGPKYRAVADALKQAIAQGDLGVGDRLPPVRELAWHLKITPGTVARAYTILTDDGRVVAEVGRGTYVADRKRPPTPGPLLSFDETTPDNINLYFSRPPDVGQVALISDGMRRLADTPRRSLMDYPSAEAYAPARRAVLRWLSDAVLGPADEDQVVLSHGGQSGVSLVLQSVLKGPSPVVLVEEVFYPGFRRAAQLARAEIVPVPMDAHGLIPAALDELCQKHEAQVLCTSAEVHNPTGLFTPPERRDEIAKVAARHGLNVLEDDCYRLGPSRAPTYRALLPDLGWYVNSLSKTLAPSLRIGFVVAPAAQARRLRQTAEHGFFGLSEPLAMLVEDLLQREETYEVTTRAREEIARYVRAAVNILGRYDLTWNEQVPFLWLRLPQGWRAGSFAQAAEAQGVRIRAAEEFVTRDGRVPHAVRIGVNAQLSLKTFETAIARLRDMLDNPPERMTV